MGLTWFRQSHEIRDATREAFAVSEANKVKANDAFYNAPEMEMRLAA